MNFDFKIKGGKKEGRAGVLEVFICNWSGQVDLRRGTELISAAEVRC